ncbi:MAG: class I SAM-dependent methyltransferase [Treponema sp.]|jgi:ubiquinone/menaquinone biosynthesis C-methylase UbiE|nr:class I SAM-dependent methyltransferase [Treponema sp.]
MDALAEKALDFDRIAEEVFAPIYQVIASRLLELSGVGRGCCLDIGCGGGHLGLAVAKRFDGEVILLDYNPHALALTDGRIGETDRQRIRTICADVHDMPLADNSMNLIISRGAMWFWDKEKSLQEIWRVLAPDGAACIGGGYGSLVLKEAIFRKLSEQNNEDFGMRQKKMSSGASPEDYALVLEQMGVRDYQVIHEESGDWLLFRKASSL